MEKIKNLLLDILFPRFCLGCGIEGTYLCQDCKAILEISENKYCLCEKNALRLPSKEEKGKCSKCHSKKLSGLYSALSYKEKFLTRKLIHFLKYPPYFAKTLAETLAFLIIDHISLLGKDPKNFFENRILIPVPLEKKKLNQRGFNQSEEIAKKLSEISGAPLIADCLIKIKTTPPQMKLSGKEREENLKNAFLCKNSELVRGKKIFLIDDVYTTGTTIEECAKVLKKAGAKEIWGIVVARD